LTFPSETFVFITWNVVENRSTEHEPNILLAVKSGKAAGFDGVFPKFIEISGQRIKNGSLLF
jgi:hypothetical protein